MKLDTPISNFSGDIAEWLQEIDSEHFRPADPRPISQPRDFADSQVRLEELVCGVHARSEFPSLPLMNFRIRQAS